MRLNVLVSCCAAIQYSESTGVFLRFQTKERVLRVKVNSICGASRDTRSFCHKFSSHGPDLRILGISVASSKSRDRDRDRDPGSWVSGSHIQESQFQGPVFQGHRFSGPRVPGLRVLGPGSQVLILNYAMIKHIHF